MMCIGKIDREAEKEMLQVFKKALSTMDVNAQDANGWTALHLTVLNKNFSLFEALLASGASVDIRTNLGWHPLHTLAKLPYLEKDSVPKTKRGKGVEYFPRVFSSKSDKLARDKHVEDFADLLIKNSADINLTIGKASSAGGGYTPLDIAALNGNRAVARKLLEADAVANTLKFGTCLFKAVQNAKDRYITIFGSTARLAELINVPRGTISYLPSSHF